MSFLRASLRAEDVHGKKVIEFGSKDINGSPREVIEPLKPSEYTGVDIQPGPGVDLICDVCSLGSTFPSVFDVVICTEVLEHVEDWRGAVSTIKTVCVPGGIVIVTTRSQGFKKHDYPGDYWRYSVADMQAIFSDFAVMTLLEDTDIHFPGVFLKAVKPDEWRETGLSSVDLFRVK